MSRYMREELVGKIIAVNSFELRHRPNINMGDVDESVWREYARRRRIRVEDVQPGGEALPGGTLGGGQSGNNVRAGSRYARPRTVFAMGVTEDWFTIKRWNVSSGRLITPQEYHFGAAVLVIGQDVADHFFSSVTPLGRELKIDGIPYTIVGVAEKQGSAFGVSFDKFVVAPHDAPLYRILNWHGVIDAVIVQSESQTVMLDAM